MSAPLLDYATFARAAARHGEFPELTLSDPLKLQDSRTEDADPPAHVREKIAKRIACLRGMRGPLAAEQYTVPEILEVGELEE